MTKNQILTIFYSSDELNRMLKKHDGGAGNDDLKSELMLVLCSQPEEKIIELHEKKQLMYFATGIVQRMIFQKGSKFTRTYRKTYLEYTDNHEQEQESYDKEKDVKEQKVFDVIEKDLHWVEKSMLQIYLQKGGLYKAAQATGIPVRQVSQILKKIRCKIDTAMNGKLVGNYVIGSMEFVLDVNTDVTPETVLDLLDEALDYVKSKLEGVQIPTKNGNDAYFKEIKPIKIKKVI